LAYKDRNVLTDLGGMPVSQYDNQLVNAYEVVQGANGAIRTMLHDASGAPLLTAGNPGLVQLTGSNVEQTLGSALPSKANLMGISDGTSIRAFSGNLQGTLLASAARTVSTNSAVQTNYNARGVLVFLRISASGGSGGLRVKIRGYDPVTNTALDLNPDQAYVAAVGWSIYEVYPGVTSQAGASQFITQATSAALPRTWDITVLPADTSSYTYSVGYALIL
jgi:hypothetical protein